MKKEENNNIITIIESKIWRKLYLWIVNIINIQAFINEYRPVNRSAEDAFLFVKKDKAIARYSDMRRRGKFKPQYLPPNGELIKSAGSDDWTSE